jgi:hypothetical protein
MPDAHPMSLQHRLNSPDYRRDAIIEKIVAAGRAQPICDDRHGGEYEGILGHGLAASFSPNFQLPNKHRYGSKNLLEQIAKFPRRGISQDRAACFVAAWQATVAGAIC